MPNTREKLIELLREVQYLGGLEEKIADRLIANGVTIADDVSAVAYNLSPTEQKWIPVSERLPEDTLPKFSAAKQIKVLTTLKSDNGVRTVRSQMRYRDAWCDEVRWRWKYSGGEVTHWMPLPEPPKGE